jgi:tetratricopeptide (TPR) repeat protein
VPRRSSKADRAPRTAPSSPRAVAGPRRFPVVIVAAAVAVAYANSLSGPFVLDDEATIVQNPQIRDLSRPGDVLRPAPDSPIAGRPLASVTFALNYAFGGLDVRGYHIVNILLHVVCAALLFAIVRRTLERRRAAGAEPARAERVALAAALLWALHPLNTEVVDYLSQRTESLMAACYLLTMYGAIRAVESLPFCKGVGGHLMRTPPAGTARGRWGAAAVVACAAGALSKESIATAPIMIAVYDRVFLFDAWRDQLAARARLYAGLAASWVLIAALVVTAPRSSVAGFSSGVSPWTYLLNQAPMIVEYLRLAAWPDSLVAFYGWPLPMTIADVAVPAACVLALLVATGSAVWRWPAIGFLGVWFFVTLAPASSIIPIATEVGAERRMYLPLMALAVLAAAALEWVSAGVASAVARTVSARARAGVFLLAVAALSAILASATIARNREYSSGLTLAQTIVERRPNGVAHHMVAEQLIHAQRNDEAMQHLRRAVALGNSRARYLLAQGLALQGKHDEAVEQLEAFLRTYMPTTPLVPRWLEPPLTEVIPARFLLGRALGLQGKWAPAAEQARLILDVVPGHVGARGLLGDAMFAQERWTDAAKSYEEYLERQPADARVWMNYGIAQVAVERFDDAIAAFGRAAELDPANPRPKELIALAREDRARLGERR